MHNYAYITIRICNLCISKINFAAHSFRFISSFDSLQNALVKITDKEYRLLQMIIIICDTYLSFMNLLQWKLKRKE